MQKQNKAKTKRIRDKHAFLTIELLAGKKSADSQLAGNFPTNVAGTWNFSYHPAGSAEQIFFSQQQKKIVKKTLKAFTYHFYGLFDTFCENVSLGAPEAC